MRPSRYFDTLSDPLLELVLAAVREDTRTEGGASACCGGADVDAACAPGARALPLVCKRWRHVFHTSAVLHGTLSLDLKQLEARISSPEDEAALRRVLQLRGQAARRLWLHSGGRRLSMPDVLALLAPQLQAAYLGNDAAADSLAHLRRFCALRCLDLPACTYADAAGLARFAQLEELTLREGASEQLLRVLADLPRLRLLSLTAVGALPPAFHALLGRLRRLEGLDLYLLPSQPAAFELQPGALAGLHRLRSLLVVAPPGSACQALSLGPGLPRLPALQELQVECRVEALPPDLWACAALTRLDLDLRHSAALPAPAAPPSGTSPLPSLRELRLARVRLPGGALPPALCALSQLRRLEVSRCGLASGCTSAGVPAECSRLTRLERLSLEGNALCTLPPALTALCALRHLDLTANQLAWLPPGPYLRRLEALLLSGNRLAQVPPVLAAAGACEVLDLSANPALELSRHDVDATLARMPRLALLLLGKGGMEGGLGLAPHPHGAAPAAAEWQWRTASVASLVALAQALPGLQIDFEHTAKEYEEI